MSYRIAVVEDQPPVRQELARALTAAGYEVLIAQRFDAIPAWVQEQSPDLVLLDLGLPGVDGQWVCREITSTTSTPVIVVTARDGEIDELMAMNFGADDYITKPYNIHILLAHINAVLTRTYTAPHVVTAAGITLDPTRNEIRVGDQTARLTHNEQRLLSCLMAHAGQIVSREFLQAELWESDQFVDDNTLSVNVSYLRSTLASVGAGDRITTVRGRGYMLEKQ